MINSSNVTLDKISCYHVWDILFVILFLFVGVYFCWTCNRYNSNTQLPLALEPKPITIVDEQTDLSETKIGSPEPEDKNLPSYSEIVS